MAVRVLLVDDHRLVREGLRRTLADAGIEVVAEAADGEGLVELVTRWSPHVVLMDLSLPTVDGLTATRRLRRRVPQARVVVLTMHDDDDLVEQAYAAGAVDYLVKDAAGEQVVEAVRRAAGPVEGEAEAAASVLTRREREVLQLLADGCRPEEVAQRLFISPKTVRNHLTNVYAKLGVTDRVQAVVAGLRAGLIELP